MVMGYFSDSKMKLPNKTKQKTLKMVVPLQSSPAPQLWAESLPEVWCDHSPALYRMGKPSKI